jgi:hypothetical protein
MRTNAPLYSLNAGEVSKIAVGRIDIAKLRIAGECQLNWLPYVLGPMMLRPGLLYTGEVSGDNPAKLMRFVFSKLDTALIEFTANAMRVWIDEVLLTRPAVATAIQDPYFVNTGAWSSANTTAGAAVTIAKDASDDMGTCVLTCTPVGGLAQIQQTVNVGPADRGVEHGIRIVIAEGPVTFRAGSTAGVADLIAQTVLDTGTHSLSCTPTTASFVIQIESTDQWSKTIPQCAIEPAGVVTLPTPWGSVDLANIRYDQSGDIVYVACYGQPQQMIERRGARPGARGWSVVRYRVDDGPFNSLPGRQANFAPSIYYGNGTLTSDKPWFQPGHVGALFRLFSPGQNNQAVLGAQNAFTNPVRISGVDNDRLISCIVSGIWSGTLTLQRSLDGPTSGFMAVSTATANGIVNYNDTASDLDDNVICWLRWASPMPETMSAARRPSSSAMRMADRPAAH